jgi:DNA polymerase I
MAAARLLLVDGLPVFYRAYFAIRGLSTRSGQPTNALFGFIRMLRQMRDLWRPTHCAVVFDGGLPPRRLALLPQYKAQRPEMPAALRSQIPLGEEYLARVGVPWMRVPGQEADDVIASLAARAAGDAQDVLVASSDKDLYQIVNSRTRMVPVSGREEAVGEEEVVRRTGVLPGQVVDWLALAGDSVDNIPGVPGVGPKTAARLLQQFGSLDALGARLVEIAGERVGRAVAEHWAAVLRNRELVRLQTDLPAPLAWDALAVRPPDVRRLLPFLEDLEFHAMARDLREPDLFGAAP